MPRPPDHPHRMHLARRALEGLSVGDAFGERFFVSPATVERLIEQRAVPASPWRWTNDTAMALGVCEVLDDHGAIDSRRAGRRVRAALSGRARPRLQASSLEETAASLEEITATVKQNALAWSQASASNRTAFRSTSLRTTHGATPPGWRVPLPQRRATGTIGTREGTNPMSMFGRNRFVVAGRARHARLVLVGVVGAMVVTACSSSSSNGGNGGTPDAGGDVSMAMTCTPGQSIACVGPGGCSGGQACTSDGSGYGACECAAVSDAGEASTSTGSDGATGEAGKPDASPEAGPADAGTCSTYATTTIAAMRTAGVSGCFKLSDVASTGLAPSATAPRLFVQDPSGGDYSAMMTTCATASSTHPCGVASSVSAIADGRSVTVTGSYVISAATHFEQFFVDGITDNGTATPPAPAAATLAQIERASTSYNLAFQHVTLTVSGADTLQMYDFTPSELVYAGAAACPYVAGFGMIPKSVGGVTAGAACSSGSAQPPGQSAPNAAEVLIGTDFYTGYTVSSDCRCAKTSSDLEPAAISTLGGPLGGMLVSSLASGASAGFFYLAPKTGTDAPVTNTVAGM